MMTAMNRTAEITQDNRGQSCDPPEVSVVIPTRNRWYTLENRALRAALTQRDVRLEVIVVDDGSQTPRPQIAALKDPRVRLIRTDGHSGVAAARNAGSADARAEWIAFLDDDDMWAPDKLASVLAALGNAGADFGYSSVLILDRDLRPAEVARGCPPEVLADALRHGNHISAPASNLVVKASLLRRVGGFDEAFSTLPMWDLCLRLARAGRAESVDEVLVGYPEGRWLLEDEPANWRDVQRMAIKHKGMAVDWYGYERWVADISCRAGQRRDAARRYLRASVHHYNMKCLVLAGAALLGRGAVERLRQVPEVEAPEWLSLYLDGD
jgi:glycosyltransferase involved in cell wall biosynthesis